MSATIFETIAIITACGRGVRFSNNLQSDEITNKFIPKQYLDVAGMPIIRRSILAFLNHKKIDKVICVIHPEDVGYYRNAVKGFDLLEPVFGSERRQDSVRIALKEIEKYQPKKVLIHDSVRPLIDEKTISRVIEELENNQFLNSENHQIKVRTKAVIPVIAIADTLKKVKNNLVQETCDRDNFFLVQTPQGFDYQEILTAHLKYQNIDFTDDASLIEQNGGLITTVLGSQNNFKITKPEDYQKANMILENNLAKNNSEIRVGIGFDVHKFGEINQQNNIKNFIRIAGVDIEFDKKIIAHSDGDVAIHALMDAILGSISQGDIGQHFPDNDEKWRNIDSCVMLKIVADLLEQKKYKITNIDLIIMAEAPKILPHKKNMAQILATILSLDEDKINIKATTTEKLGFIGRGEGIAAQAVVSVSNR